MCSLCSLYACLCVSSASQPGTELSREWEDTNDKKKAKVRASGWVRGPTYLYHMDLTAKPGFERPTGVSVLVRVCVWSTSKLQSWSAGEEEHDWSSGLFLLIWMLFKLKWALVKALFSYLCWLIWLVICALCVCVSVFFIFLLYNDSSLHLSERETEIHWVLSLPSLVSLNTMTSPSLSIFQNYSHSVCSFGLHVYLPLFYLICENKAGWLYY